jgi:hypothetical protein
MKRTVVAVVAMLFVPASALAQTLPRYALKPGMTLRQSLANGERQINRAAGFSAASCWVYDGNAKLGWRHTACVGNYSYAGTTYRFKVTSTPVSCSRERFTFVVPGVQRRTYTQAWKHRVFNCKLSG